MSVPLPTPALRVELGSLLPAPEVNAAARVTFAFVGELELPRASRGAAREIVARQAAVMKDFCMCIVTERTDE